MPVNITSKLWNNNPHAYIKEEDSEIPLSVPCLNLHAGSCYFKEWEIDIYFLALNLSDEFKKRKLFCPEI
jgi:hypothetical protein